MSWERELTYRLHVLRLKLEIAQENEYALVQPLIRSEISRVEHDLAEGGDFYPPRRRRGIEDYR